MKRNTYLYIFVSILFLIFIMMIYRNRNKNRNNIDKFDNMEDNIYTFDTCCTEKEKENCMTYGKTGVCNYYKNNGNCLCQNAY